MAKQQNDFAEITGNETYWTNSAFSGMPTYQLGAKYPHNYIKKLDLILSIPYDRFGYKLISNSSLIDNMVLSLPNVSPSGS